MLELEKLHQKSINQSGLASVRTKALGELQSSILPNRKSEFWKYTYNFNWLESLKVPQKETPAPNVLSKLPDHCGRLIFSCGKLDAFQTQIPPGMKIHLRSQNQNIFDLKAGHANNTHWSFFSKLNQVSAPEQYILEVDSGEIFQKPFLIINHSDKDVLSSLNLTIRLGEGSQLNVLQLLQDLTSPSTPSENGSLSGHLGSYLWEIGQKAKLEHVVIDSGGDQYNSLANIEYHLNGEEAKVASHAFSTGGDQIRLDLRADLNSANSHFFGRGFYGIAGKAHHDFYLGVHHHKPDTTSELLYKGLLQDSATGVFTGHIVIDKYAQKSNAELLNKNLLLGEKALIQTRPQLEVYADDVKAGHGATVGRLDDEQLFYLESRGISKIRALELLYQGFIDDVLERIENSELSRFVKDHLQNVYSTSHAGSVDLGESK